MDQFKRLRSEISDQDENSMMIPPLVHQHQNRQGSPVPISTTFANINANDNSNNNNNNTFQYITSQKMLFRRHGPPSVSPIPNHHHHNVINSNSNSNSNNTSFSFYNNSTNAGICVSSTASASVVRVVEPDVPLERLSRHVPDRDNMDLNMSSMILSQQGVEQQQHSSQHHHHQQQSNINNNNSSRHQNNNEDDANNNNNNSLLNSSLTFGGGNSSIIIIGGDGRELDQSSILVHENQNNNNESGNNNNNNNNTSRNGLNTSTVEEENSNESFSNYRDNLANTMFSRNHHQHHQHEHQQQARTQHQNNVRGGGGSNNNTNNNNSDVLTFGGRPNHQSNTRSSQLISRHHDALRLRNDDYFYSSSSSSTVGHQTNGSNSNASRRAALNLNPEKVLDAPELPTEPCQLLDWGSENHLVIGLNSVLYSWNASTGEPRTVCDLSSEENNNNDNTNNTNNTIITAVSWINKDRSAAICLNKSRLAIVDAQTGVIRNYMIPGVDSGLTNNPHLPIINSMAVVGPLIAVATTLGTVCLYDVRKKTLSGHFDAHQGGVSKATFCSSEPFYLATGGSCDSSIRLWDYRNTSVARYSYEGVFNQQQNNIINRSHHNSNSNNIPTPHNTTSRHHHHHHHNNYNYNHLHVPSVTAISFFADKRSVLFAGSSSGQLISLNAHGSHEDYLVSSANTGCAPITGIISSPGTGEIATSHGQGAGVVQLRRADKFQHLGSFSGPGTTAAINCITLAPDGERICAAQMDETLKFWKVFNNNNNKHTHHRRHEQQTTTATTTTNATSTQNRVGGIIAPGDRIRSRRGTEDYYDEEDEVNGYGGDNNNTNESSSISIR